MAFIGPCGFFRDTPKWWLSCWFPLKTTIRGTLKKRLNHVVPAYFSSATGSRQHSQASEQSGQKTHCSLGATRDDHGAFGSQTSARNDHGVLTTGHMAMGQNPNSTPSEHPNPHENRLTWVVHLPQNGTIGFDPQLYDNYQVKVKLAHVFLKESCPAIVCVISCAFLFQFSFNFHEEGHHFMDTATTSKPS